VNDATEQKTPSTAGAAKAIVAVMRDIGAIGKDRENTVQRYKFRGVDDIYNELHPIMAKHGLFTVPRVLRHSAEEKVSKSGSVQIYRVLEIEFDFVAENGDSITVGPFIGEGMDSGDKAANKAHAVAHKYAFLQVFAIPTEDDKDPENTTHDLKPSARPSPQEEADAIVADIYAAGANLPKDVQSKIQQDIDAAGNDVARLDKILTGVRRATKPTPTN